MDLKLNSFDASLLSGGIRREGQKVISTSCSGMKRRSQMVQDNHHSGGDAAHYVYLKKERKFVLDSFACSEPMR